MQSSYVEVVKLRKEVERLKNKLNHFHHFILCSLPRELRSLLGDYDLGGNWDTWSRKVVERVVGLSLVKTEGMGYSSDRGLCPLCQRGAEHQGLDGYTIPIGLTRHLAGTHGVQQCEVMEAADELAGDHFRWEEEKARRLA